jgi:hypothetical protein
MQKFTPKETQVLELVLDGKVTYFDDGVQKDSGSWGKIFASEIAESSIQLNIEGAGAVISNLIKKGVFQTHTSDFMVWVRFTDEGANATNDLRGE